MVEDHAFANARSQGHHPSGAGKGVTCSMVLEAVAAGIVVGVAAKIRQDKQRSLSCVLWFALDNFPNVGAESVCAANAINVERIRPRVRNVDVVHGNPQEAGRDLAHELTHDVDREFVWAGQSQRVRLEVVNRKLEHHSQLLQLEFVAPELRCVERHLIIVAQQMLVVGAAGGRGRQEVLRENDARAGAWTVRTVAALANTIETVAWSDNPGVGGGALQILAEIFEDRGML